MYCGGSQSKGAFDDCLEIDSKLIDMLGDDKGFIYFNPGGNWGNVYRHVMETRLKVWKLAYDNEIPFVSGPQSIYYQSNSKAAMYDQKFVKLVGKPKDLLTFRQRDSYEFAALQYGNYTTVKECPDMAFMLGAQSPTKAAAFDVFLLMRNDGESLFESTNMHDDICEGIAEEGFTCAVGDWGVDKDIATSFSGIDSTSHPDLSVELATDTISLGELIVTDRLHGAIFAFLAGKPVIYVDNSYDKLSNSISTAFREASSCLDEESMGVFEISQNVPEIIEYVVAYLKKWGKAIQYEDSEDKVRGHFKESTEE